MKRSNLSKTENRSKASDGQAFCDRTAIPARAWVAQMRTLGVPSTVQRQLGQRPAQQKRPRGRWYLKLRERIWISAACSAPASVWPALARTGRPSNVNSTLSPDSATGGLLGREPAALQGPVRAR